LVLVDLQERSYAEAAAVAGVSEDVLRTRLHRARRQLAALLNEGAAP
jgi:RNA polymerase sigma-70 factor (ECF subfamily)